MLVKGEKDRVFIDREKKRNARVSVEILNFGTMTGKFRELVDMMQRI